MPPLLLVIRNVCTQGEAPQEVIENINYVDEILREVLDEFHN
jgi:predicted RNase H-like HicB family nuclease